MSRSRSPNYRRFPWEESNFDPHKILAELDENPHNRSHRLRQTPEEDWGFDREEMYPEGQRRSPPFPDDHFQLEHQRRPDVEEFYNRASSPHYDERGYEGRRVSPPRNAGGDSDRRREGFQDQSYDNRGRLPRSPPSLVRERLPPRSQAVHQQREPGMGWREEQGRGPGRFRDLSPATRTDDQRSGAGRERGRRHLQGPNRDRQREEPHQERSPPFKRQRREMDDANHPGYRNEEEFGEQRYSVETPRDGFGGDTQGSLPRGDVRPLRPLVIEHDHGIVNVKKLPQWEQLAKRRDLDFNRQRSPRPQGSSQERFRTSDTRLDDREDVRGRRFQDNWRDSNYVESRRSPVPQDRPNTMRYGNRDGSLNPRGRGCPRPGRGRFNRGQVGRAGPLRTQPRLQQSSQGYQDLPHGEQRLGYRPFREDGNKDPMEGGPRWSEEDRLQEREHDRPRSLEQHLLRDDLDPKMPRGWSDKKTSNMAAVKEETLTIKVDMTRPINQNSLPCYSSERQLSLDLVNVGRQRLDFLPMLEHSGTYQETAMHTGTFAQEIITLVHHVKEQYFRDDGLTLNERFSVPQTSGFSEEETVELTLDERFSSNRGFSLNMKSLHDDDEPLFSRLESMQGLNQQLVRDPGDLRHDLERRRQERLEGVTVTIPGGSMSQRPLGQVSEPEFIDEMSPLEDDRFSTWPEEQSRRQEGNMVPRRGASLRPNSGSQRRNNRFINRAGPMRRQNNRNNPAGPTW
ncbi:BCLAF1 and THRAP3 family member 3 isoform X2 [Hippoglossus hippoglossus]|uniref:BCLAF1 and THRAP3 family member 3 isoform X2 n=1 Tax=Hippoglossus hippoglossus TaxID=8267 RepID=UPI00148DA2E4|nr:BCLAF1 and THRAP3 family member 3 isoform X2 [Hippoglossus hippoglossus]